MRVVGRYYPNAAGSRERLYIDDKMVTAQVYARSDGVQVLAVFIGLELIHEKPLPATVTRPAQINPYVRIIAIDHTNGVFAECKDEDTRDAARESAAGAYPDEINTPDDPMSTAAARSMARLNALIDLRHELCQMLFSAQTEPQMAALKKLIGDCERVIVL